MLLKNYRGVRKGETQERPDKDKANKNQDYKFNIQSQSKNFINIWLVKDDRRKMDLTAF